MFCVISLIISFTIIFFNIATRVATTSEKYMSYNNFCLHLGVSRALVLFGIAVSCSCLVLVMLVSVLVLGMMSWPCLESWGLLSC